MRSVFLAILLIGLPAVAFADDTSVKVYVNGKLQKYAPAARVREGTTYVPIRQGATSLGFEVKWLADQNAALICSDIACILIPKEEGIIVNDRLFLPLRKMGESLDVKVRWDGKKKAVFMQKPDKQ